MRDFNKRSAGFTLLEMMIGVAIVAVMASIALPAYSKYVTEARRSEAVGMLMHTLRLQKEVPIQWATRGETAFQLGLVEPLAINREFCQNLQFTEYLEASTPGVPTVPARFPGSKYNLILGKAAGGCWSDSVVGFTELAALPGYGHLTRAANEFGANSDTGEFLMGAERTFADGSLDVLFINSNGALFLLCDQGETIEEASQVFQGVTFSNPACSVSMSADSGGNGGADASAGSDGGAGFPDL